MLIEGGHKKPTESDYVISAAFDLPPDTEKSFDLAIMDDYTVDGLYNDCVIRLGELQALRDMWAGEITAAFAEKLLPAFLETESVRIYQVLIGAIESFTNTERERIRSQLSQHARRGVIESAPKIFMTADRKALSYYIVRFEDDSVLYIADDSAALKGLQRKLVPAVLSKELPADWKVGDSVVVATSIVRAIMSRIPISAFSPVWQRNWTLLDQIETLKASVGTPENASVFILDDTLHFSVHPHKTLHFWITSIYSHRRMWRLA